MRCPINFIALLLLSPLVGPLGAQTGSSGFGVAQTPRQTWEYRELWRTDIEALAPKDSKQSFADGLNKLGAEGWELVTVHQEPSQTPKYLFKRSKAQGGQVKEAKEAKGADGMPTIQVIRLKNAKAADMVKTLGTLFRNMPGLQLTADERTNTLLLAGTAEQNAEVQKVVIELDGIESDAAPPKKK